MSKFGDQRSMQTRRNTAIYFCAPMNVPIHLEEEEGRRLLTPTSLFHPDQGPAPSPWSLCVNAGITSVTFWRFSCYHTLSEYKGLNSEVETDSLSVCIKLPTPWSNPKTPRWAGLTNINENCPHQGGRGLFKLCVSFKCEVQLSLFKLQFYIYRTQKCVFFIYKFSRQRVPQSHCSK